MTIIDPSLTVALFAGRRGGQPVTRLVAYAADQGFDQRKRLMIPFSALTHLQCDLCEQLTPIDQMRKQSSYKSGYRWNCKACWAAVAREAFASGLWVSSTSTSGPRSAEQRLKDAVRAKTRAMFGPASARRCFRCPANACEWHHFSYFGTESWKDCVALCEQCHHVAHHGAAAEIVPQWIQLAIAV